MQLDALATADNLRAFSPAHWVALACIAAVAIALVVWVRRSRSRPIGWGVQRTVCGGLAIVLFGGWLLSQVQLVWEGTWTIQESLPLHLCDIGMLVTASAALGCGFRRRNPRDVSVGSAPPPCAASRWQGMYELSYYWGIGGTMQALLTPDVGAPAVSAACVRYFINHGAIVVTVLVLTLGLGLRPRRGSFGRVWLTTLGLAVVVMLIDMLINHVAGPGANYMYLCGPPKSPTLYNLFGPWPWALLTLVGVGSVILALCYAPFWIVDRRRKVAPAAASSPPTGHEPLA